MAGIQVDRDALQAKANEIAELDVILDAQSGSKAAGKRSIINGLMTQADDRFVGSVVEKLQENFSGEELYATFYALVSSLENEVSDEAEQFVAEKVESKQAAVSEKLPADEILKVSEERKQHVQEFKALKSILEMFGTDVSDIEDPKTRRGGRGPRGPRTLSKFQYQVNETVLDEDSNSLATVAKLSGDIKVKDLKEFITDQGVDLKNPPAEWTATLPNNVGTLTATALPEYAADFEEDTDEAA